MDWIHCNTCGIQPSASVAVTFRLTSCGHVFCQYCEKEGAIDECKICRNKDVTTIKLSSEMKQEIEVYFQDPEVLASQLLRVIEFQKGHRMRYIEFLQKKVQKYNLAKVHLAKLEDRLKEEQEIKLKLIEQNKKLIRELESYKNRDQIGNSSSPSMNLNKPLLSTNSRASQLIRSAGENLNNNTNYRSKNNNNPQQQINSPFSVCSTPRNNFHNYRNPRFMNTPVTPSSIISDTSSTPLSNISIAKSLRNGMTVLVNKAGSQSNNQRMNTMAGRTPPNIGLLKIGNIYPRINQAM